MNELDEMWSATLAHAAEQARAGNRHDVADYLDLKAANDLIRTTGVRWLFDTLIEYAASANRSNAAVTIERTDPHSFSHRGANIVGSSVSFRYGVRCLIAEAGWTRTPADGFMRGGGLAFARLRHFGVPKASVEMTLLLSGANPAWILTTDAGTRDAVHAEYLLGHVRLLTEG